MPCTDLARAAAFYRAVLGWDAGSAEGEAAAAPLPGYMAGVDGVRMFQCGRLSGAFVKMSRDDDVATVADGSRPARMAVLPSFMVNDIDATLAKAGANGGKVHL